MEMDTTEASIDTGFQSNGEIVRIDYEMNDVPAMRLPAHRAPLSVYQ